MLTAKCLVIRQTQQLTKIIILSICFIFPLAHFNTALANGIKKIVILPFEIHSSKDITHIQHGIEQMLCSRLTWPEHTTIVDKRTIVDLLKKNNKLPKDKLISSIAEETRSDYVLMGSITEFADAFSIDANIYDIRDKTVKPFFSQVDKTDRIIPEISLLAAKINKTVFDRMTEQYEEFKEEKSYARQRQQQQRMDPEKMVPPQNESDYKEEKVGWRLWKYIW